MGVSVCVYMTVCFFTKMSLGILFFYSPVCAQRLKQKYDDRQTDA